MYLGIKKKQKVNEADGISGLGRRIAKRSFIIAAKLNREQDSRERDELVGALSLMTQAQMLAGKDDKEALRLFNIANRLAVRD
jgi:hypothetical protein